MLGIKEESLADPSPASNALQEEFLGQMVKAENETITVDSNPMRSSKSEYFTGKFHPANLISSPKSSQKSSSKPSSSKRYVVLDDMTVLEVVSSDRQRRQKGGMDALSSRVTKKNPSKSPLLLFN